MKIGIFGNTNNYPYLLAMGLRQLGADVRLVVNRPERLHRPESKVPALADGYPDWILDLGLAAEAYTITDSPLARDAVRFLGTDLNAVFLNDVGPALHDHFDCPVLALLTGSDLLYHASFASIDERISGWPPEMAACEHGRAAIAAMRRCVEAQRAGIARATAVSFMPSGSFFEGDEILAELGVARDDPRRFFVYQADTLTLQVEPPPLRRRMHVFNGARLVWHRPLPPGFSELDHKGTDVLVCGFAEFLAAGGEGELRLVRKGYDARRTEDLVRDLGVAGDVVWLDELSLFDFHKEMASADVVCDQFGQSIPGMVALDAMAMGRPVLSNFRLDAMAAYFPEPRPFCHAADPAEVCRHLLELYRRPRLRTEIGRQAVDYVARLRSPQANALECLGRLGLSLG